MQQRLWEVGRVQYVAAHAISDIELLVTWGYTWDKWRIERKHNKCQALLTILGTKNNTTCRGMLWEQETRNIQFCCYLDNSLQRLQCEKMCESELFESSEWKQSLLMKDTSDVDLLLKCCCHAVADSPSRKALVSSGGDIVRDSRLADFMSDISFSTSPFLAMIALSTSATWKYFNMSWRKYLDPISDSSSCTILLLERLHIFCILHSNLQHFCQFRTEMNSNWELKIQAANSVWLFWCNASVENIWESWDDSKLSALLLVSSKLLMSDNDLKQFLVLASLWPAMRRKKYFSCFFVLRCIVLHLMLIKVMIAERRTK